MARPKKEKKDLRTARLPHIRCTEMEHQVIKNNAKASGMSISDYIRFLALNKGEIVTPVANDNHEVLQSLDDALVYELHRIGNNLNQLTKRYHQDRKEPVGLQALFPVLENVLNHIFKRLNIES